jgi:hypothetical protein
MISVNNKLQIIKVKICDVELVEGIKLNHL